MNEIQKKERVIKANGVYTPIVHRGRMYGPEDIDIILELMNSKFNKVFRTKQLADEMLAKKYNCSIRNIWFDMYLKEERDKVSQSLSFVMISFQKAGIIEKHSNIKSNNFWRKL